MALIQDPRFRQRWNRISHNAETVTENAAAGIWTFQHQYINPCFGVLADAFDSCAGVCIGDRDERARRARESDRGARRTRAEYMFDFYDDWDDELDDDALGGPGGGGSNILGTWGGGRREDWDRLLAGTGSVRTGAGGGEGGGGGGKHAVAGLESVVDRQPRKKRGMSYGTRAAHRKASLQEDATIIPSTAPLGFLGRLPFKIGGTLRYKPSAANLKDHPGGAAAGHEAENEPLLGTSSDEGDMQPHGSPQPRQRSGTSGTAGSTATSASFCSRGDLFPSDEEGDEDAIPLDDEFAVELARVDADAKRANANTNTATSTSGAPESPSLELLQCEEAEAEREEQEERERKRMAAARLAKNLGLASKHDSLDKDVHEVFAEVMGGLNGSDAGADKAVFNGEAAERLKTSTSDDGFVPARLPHLG